VWCSKYSCLCSESIECFPGIASKFFLKLLVTIPVTPIITDIIVNFRFHIRCASIPKLSYFNFFSASFAQHFCLPILTIYQCAYFLFFVFNYYNWPICCNFSVCTVWLLLLLFLLLLLLLLELSHVISDFSIFNSLVEVVGTFLRISGHFASGFFSVELQFLFRRFRRVWDSSELPSVVQNRRLRSLSVCHSHSTNCRATSNSSVKTGNIKSYEMARITTRKDKTYLKIKCLRFLRT